VITVGEDEQKTVWRTARSADASHYHEDTDCGYLNDEKNPKERTMEQVQKARLDPCPRCVLNEPEPKKEKGRPCPFCDEHIKFMAFHLKDCPEAPREVEHQR
jgi:hypothetical protein